MTPLLAARGKHFAATLGLHARAKTVRFGAPAFARLKCALWQNNPPLLPMMIHTISNTRSRGHLFHPQRRNSTPIHSMAGPEFSSVFDPCAQGQETKPSVPGRFERLARGRLARTSQVRPHLRLRGPCSRELPTRRVSAGMQRKDRCRDAE
jgi:hypothetical protein